MNSLPQSLKNYLERQEDLKKFSDELSLEVEEKAVDIQPNEKQKKEIRKGRNRGNRY